LVPVLFAFYIQGVLKLKKNNSGAKRLSVELSTDKFTHLVGLNTAVNLLHDMCITLHRSFNFSVVISFMFLRFSNLVKCDIQILKYEVRNVKNVKF